MAPRRVWRPDRDLIRRAAGFSLVMLAVAFALYSYVDSRAAKRDLRRAAEELSSTRARFDQADRDREALADEVRHLQDLIEKQGGQVPPFTFPPAVQGPPGPTGPRGPAGPEGPRGGATTTTTRPPPGTTTTSSTTSTTTTGPPNTILPPVTLPRGLS